MKYRVAWISMRTGNTGHGSPMSHTNAIEAAKLGDNRYSTLKHWVEQAYKLQYKVTE